MSKQSDAKVAQGYQENPLIPTCSNCEHYTSEIKEIKSTFSINKTWKEEKNIRCGIGQFKIKKTAICNKWTENENEQ